MIVDESADIDYAAKKAAITAFANFGQVCIRCDYVLCHESKFKEFTQLTKQYAEQYHQDGSCKEVFGHCISDFHQKRLCGMLKDHGG